MNWFAFGGFAMFGFFSFIPFIASFYEESKVISMIALFVYVGGCFMLGQYFA